MRPWHHGYKGRRCQVAAENETWWNQDFAARDAGRLSERYADDAVLMITGRPASSGKDAIRKTLTEMAADPALAVKFAPSHVEVARSGDVAFTQGSYSLTMTDPNSKQVINDHGSYVTTYRKQAGGSWEGIGHSDLGGSTAAGAGTEEEMTED